MFSPTSPTHSISSNEDSHSQLLHQRRRLLDVIEDFRNEIKSLHAEIDHEITSRQLIPDPNELVQEETQQQQDNLRNSSNILPSINNIRFTHTNITVIPTDNNDSQKHSYILDGFASHIPFHIEFQECDQTITNLDIRVDLICAPELENFIRDLNKSRNLLSFFRVISRYATLSSSRKQCFEYFLNRYQDIASGDPTSSSISFQDDFATLVLSWKLSPNIEGQVLPILSLKPIILRNKKLAQLMPVRYADLVEIKGVQRATEIMLDVTFAR